MNAIGPGAVEYLLHGCDPSTVDTHEHALEHAHELGLDGSEPHPGVELGRESGDGPGGHAAGADREQGDGGAGYLARGVAAGEPTGRWLGHGMEGLGLSIRAGDAVREDDARALLGGLRFPDREYPGSTAAHPVYLGAKPRGYASARERVEAALKAQPDASAERRREIEIETTRNTKSNTAYYDVTFSPVKSISMYYAALLAAGDLEGAEAVRACHDEAVRIAFDAVETDVAWARVGRHGRAGAGASVGEHAAGTGLTVAAFSHSTNRDGEPQLHTHGGVLNRIALPDGRVFALNGAAFRPLMEALTSYYERAEEQLLSERFGVSFAVRPDGKAREIVGMDPDLLAEGATRTNAHVAPRVAELVEAYTARHGFAPDQRARHAIADQAVKETRRPKSGLAGPAAVAAWADGAQGRRDRLEASLDAVDQQVAAAAARGQHLGHDAGHGVGHGREPGRGPVAAPEAVMAGDRAALAAVFGDDRVAGAVAAGLADVQGKYPSWTVGHLTRAVDWHLGDAAGALGVAAADRHLWVKAVVAEVLAPTSGWDVVRVTAGDPVPVPDVLRREVDGRSRFRAHIDERYATASHLAAEERLAAQARGDGAPRLDEHQLQLVAGQLEAAGLSRDQVAAVAGIMTSGRTVDVLVGPAGAGKSHTVAALRAHWVEQVGGRVIGTATAQIATRNLAGLGLEAVNTKVLLDALRPDETGQVHDRLRPGDLVVVDEAGMVSTDHLGAIVELAAAAGAKVVPAGDHAQLDAVGAGGMFAYLAAQPGAFELTEVHRFTHAWEREASLRLRAGAPGVVAEYADRGRLRSGSVEAMEAAAVRGYLGDILDGKTSLLIVGTNAQAAKLSEQVRRELVTLGRVGATPLATLPNGTELGLGDVIQARENDYRLRVDPGPGGVGLPVTNRETYTVVGRGPDGSLLARDERGAIAHLPEHYVREHVTLAYAVTVYAAQGLTVDIGRGLLDRDADRAAAYVPGSRGREANVFYLITEHAPDSHEPERISERAAQRMVDILARDGHDHAAVTVREAGRVEEASLPLVGELFDRVATETAHARSEARLHALLAEIAGPDHAAGIGSDPAVGRLLGAVRAAELDGHDPEALLREVIGVRSLAHARGVAEVLHWRVGQHLEQRSPERIVDPADWATYLPFPAPGGPDELDTYLAALADRATAAQAELGARLAAAEAEERPAWAARLGEAPDAALDPDGHADWTRRAGVLAVVPEMAGIPDQQGSLGEAPPPAQQFARTRWEHAIAAGGTDPAVADVRARSDAELYAAREQWSRTLGDAEIGRGLRSVADELAQAYQLAEEAHGDAAVGRARLQAMNPRDPARAELGETVARHERFAQHYSDLAAGLEDAHQGRGRWWADPDTVAVREAADAAALELTRRGLPTSRGTVPEPGPAPELDLDYTDPARPNPERVPMGEPAVTQPVAAEPVSEPGAGVEATGPEAATEEPSAGVAAERHARFLDDLAERHEQRLQEVDPEQRLDQAAREAALRAADWDRFSEALRLEHGERLDPDRALDDEDLAHARAAELAAERSARPTVERNQVEVGAGARGPDEDHAPTIEASPGIEIVRDLDPEPATDPEQLRPDLDAELEADRAPDPAPTPEREPAIEREVEPEPAAEPEPPRPDLDAEVEADRAPDPAPSPELELAPDPAPEPAVERAQEAALEADRVARAGELERAREQAAGMERARQADEAAQLARREQVEQLAREAAARHPELEPPQLEADLELGLER